MQISNRLNMQDEFDFEVVNIYLKQARLAAYFAFALILYLVITFYQVVETKSIVIWALPISLIYAYGFYASLAYTKDLPSYQISFFINRQHFLDFLAGLAWGSALLLLLDAPHPTIYDSRLLAALGVVIAFAASIMSASLRGLTLFLAAISFLAALHLLSNFEYYQWWFFALIGIVIASLLFAKLNNKYILEDVENKLLNSGYIDELRTLNDKIETTNQDFIKRNVELQDMQKQLQLLAARDGLTGLYNRRHILERIEEKLPEISRHQLNFCLVMMDIDHFKNVNDEFGHGAGDEVLRTTAQILAQQLRQGDMVARYGGEEFLMLLPMTELSSATLLVERLRAGIEKQTYQFEGTTISVTASFGITQHAPQDSADKMIDRADKALYQAKLAGRNCVKVISKPE